MAAVHAAELDALCFSFTGADDCFLPIHCQATGTYSAEVRYSNSAVSSTSGWCRGSGALHNTMAKQGMKKRAEENSKRLGLLLKAIIAANVRPTKPPIEICSADFQPHPEP